MKRTISGVLRQRAADPTFQQLAPNLVKELTEAADTLDSLFASQELKGVCSEHGASSEWACPGCFADSSAVVESLQSERDAYRGRCKRLERAMKEALDLDGKPHSWRQILGKSL